MSAGAAVTGCCERPLVGAISQTLVLWQSSVGFSQPSSTASFEMAQLLNMELTYLARLPGQPVSQAEICLSLPSQG